MNVIAAIILVTLAATGFYFAAGIYALYRSMSDVEYDFDEDEL